MYPLLAAMLTARPWGDILQAAEDPTKLRERGTPADKMQIRGYAAQYAHHIARVLERVPPVMLLLFKTNDCLRHAERRLSAPGVNPFLSTSKGIQTHTSLLTCAAASIEGSLPIPCATVTLRYSLQALRRERRAACSALRHQWRWVAAARAFIDEIRLAAAVWLLRAFSESLLIPVLLRRLTSTKLA